MDKDLPPVDAMEDRCNTDDSAPFRLVRAISGYKYFGWMDGWMVMSLDIDGTKRSSRWSDGGGGGGRTH